MIFFLHEVRYRIAGTQLQESPYMIASAIITAFSMTSLLAWFRYSCGLILSAKPAHDYTPQVAAANELGFLEVQQDLPHANERRVLDTLRQKLERDYHLLSYLLQHSPALHTGSESFEQRMMMLDFELMKACYALACLLSRSGARRILREMTQVVCYFANTMGERGVWTSVAE
jgi:hypothetical protein